MYINNCKYIEGVPAGKRSPKHIWDLNKYFWILWDLLGSSGIFWDPKE